LYFLQKLLQVSGLSFIFAIKHYVKIKIMAKRNEIYKSAASGSLVEVLNAGEGQLAGDLELLVENTTDAATEKHVPVVEKIEGGYRVTVGSVEHPMTEAHFIQWIELVTENEVLRKYLTPSDKPVAEFKTDSEALYAREYCNLHGLWKA
jgi:superoxide reductase